MISLRIRLFLLILGFAACARGNEDREARETTDTVLVYSADPATGTGVNFTPEVHAVLKAAQRAAIEQGASGTAATHFLLAILSVPGNSGLATLRALGTDVSALEAELRRLARSTPRSSPSQSIPYTRDAETSLEYAMKETLSQNRQDMTAADLLVGVVTSAQGSLADLLRAHNLNSATVRAAAHSAAGGA